jgi:clan AA aspartic protease (TIGR02281 family)
LAGTLALALAAAASAAPQVDVAQELERLMGAYGFAMKEPDLESTRESKGRAEGEELLPRLKLLLEGFDHIIVQRPDGGVERVLILGEKAPMAAASRPPAQQAADGEEDPEAEPAEEGEIVIETQRKGTSHAITLALEGNNGKRVQRVLLLDTGADYVVLPASIIPQLGLPPNALRRQAVQTANGPVEARLGRLPAIWLGGQRVEGVETAFIEDDRLGGNSLLGMSVLGRFRVTIDDENNRVTLAGR